MNFVAELMLFFPDEQGGFVAAGNAQKAFDVKTFEEAAEEAREWIRRNRMSNASNPALRWKAVLLLDGKHEWQHDETKGDSLLEPTEHTNPSCIL